MEREFLQWLMHRLPHPSLGADRFGSGGVGIGDDAACLQLPPQSQLVVTTDMLLEGTHFRCEEVSPERIGRKALGVNLSDLAAMGAEPLAAFVALGLPRGDGALRTAEQLLEGMQPLAERYGCPILGGDTNVAAGPLVISVTALGTVGPEGPLLRSAAQAGDRILVTGTLGGSRLSQQFDFEPRVREARQLHQPRQVHAAMDISDGLALDLSRMCQASGVGAIVDVARLPISAAARTLAERTGHTAVEHALADGEDFELLLAISPEVAEQLLDEQPLACGLTDVGQFVAESGLWQRDSAGTVQPLLPRGFEHH